MVLGGWAAVKRGQVETGLEQIRDGIDAYRATGGAIELSHWLGLLAEACCDTGRPEEGRRVVGEALQHVNETGVVYYQPELHRLEGELRLCCDARDATAAENSFRRSIEIARNQGAKSWELRAATSLARMWRDQGKVKRDTRTVGSGLRLVHRRLRHARSKGSEGVAERSDRVHCIGPSGDFRVWHKADMSYVDRMSALG